MSDIHSTTLFSKNVAFFKTYAAPVFEKVAPFLTEQPGAPYARQQPKTVRFNAQPPTREGIDVFTFVMLQNALRRAAAERIPFLDTPRRPTTYFLFVTGLPTDAEFKQLLIEFTPFCVIVNAPDLEKLAATFHHVNWPLHIEVLQKYGGSIHFILDQSPEETVSNAWRICREVNPCRVDNFAYVILDHHEHAEAIAEKLRSDINLIGSYLGFFQDELLMLFNTHRNLTSVQPRWYSRDAKAPADTPVFIIGAGASLDKDMAFLRANQNKAILISAGSALQPLLHAGVIPDFHVETENCNVMFKIGRMGSTDNLQSIRLVAASTVESEAIDAFQETVLYYRVALSPFALFSGDANASLSLPDPTVGNAALCLALETGFQEILLFGLDLGRLIDGGHHAKETFYYQKGIDFDVSFDIPVPGNFQEHAMTSVLFHPAIKNAEDAIRLISKNQTVFNCSDGAKISGAVAKRSQDITFPDIDKRSAVETFVARFEKQDQASTWPVQDLEQALDDFGNRFRALLNDDDAFFSGSYQKNVMALLDLKLGFLNPSPKSAANAIMMTYRGTLLALITFLEYYASRVAREDKESRFRQIMREEVLNMFSKMEELARDLLLNGDGPKEPPSIEERLAPPGAALPALRRLSRNDPCYCGSGKKFKHCHGKTS